MTGGRFVFGKPELYHLRAMQRQGKTMADAAREFKVDPNILSRATRNSEHSDEVVKLYPRMGYRRRKNGIREREMEVVPFDEVTLTVDTSLPSVRAATMRWV